MNTRLEGKVALFTSATRGLGRAERRALLAWTPAPEGSSESDHAMAASGRQSVRLDLRIAASKTDQTASSVLVLSDASQAVRLEIAFVGEQPVGVPLDGVTEEDAESDDDTEDH